MDVDEFLSAVDIGYRTVPSDCDLLAVGEMGIANTTTAATLCAALLGGGAARWAGRGTGVDDAGLARKRAAIEAALNLHRAISGDPLGVAAALACHAGMATFAEAGVSGADSPRVGRD
jgi:nicotinate-nucleotide--dimethylbenzimidazole phosphoribosyltransferase